MTVQMQPAGRPWTLDEAAAFLGIDLADLRADLAGEHQWRGRCDDPVCGRELGAGHRPGCAYWTPPRIWSPPPVRSLVDADADPDDSA